MINCLFVKFIEWCNVGCDGLYMQFCFLDLYFESGVIVVFYFLFQGFFDFFEDFESWLVLNIGCKVYGYLFVYEWVEFEDCVIVYKGVLFDSV